jgi:tetratricopeptide (TPR) repeat protein
VTRGARAPWGTAALAVACALALVSSCAGPPWFMGSPLDGHPSIPRGSAKLSFKEQRAAAATAQTRGETVLELRALLALDDVQRLTPANRERLVALLARRAAELHVLGRAVAERLDLERLARLAPARGAGLLGERAAAERAAGDAWLAIGAVDEARACYERAASLGASDLDFRVRALWGHPPPESTSLAELRIAIEILPLRVVPPVAAAYVAHGGADARTLARGLAAARQEKKEGLAARLADALRAAADAGAPDPGADAGVDAPPADVPDAGERDAADGPAPPVPPPTPLPPGLDHWVLGGLTISGRLLPLVKARPEVLDDVARAVGWVDLLLAEDDLWPDVLELAAFVFGRAARFGGTERMLGELVYATPDRAQGLARGAAVWEHLGRPREACAQWLRAARWRDDPDDPTWRTAISCARAQPGVADWKEIRGYVLGRASPARRAALAASLDADVGRQPPR